MSGATAPEPQAWVDCRECDFYETADVTQHPCCKCLTCRERCGFKPKREEDDKFADVDREDCAGCEEDL